MNTMYQKVAAIAAAVGVVTALGVTIASGGTPPATALEPPAVLDPNAPSMPQDLGVGERIILVVADRFLRSAEEARTANGEYLTGEMQGFYIAQTSQFPGLRDTSRSLGDWVLVSAFRTRSGAEEFARFMRDAEAKVLITDRVESLPGAYVGLGQEASPDGNGPLLGPIPASMPSPSSPAEGGNR